MSAPSSKRGEEAATDALSNAVASTMARAMVADLCSDLDMVILKGRAMSFHGLAAPKNSSDVDVLLKPGDLAPLEMRLGDRGWRKRPWSDPDGIFPQHSVTFFHPSWPVDVDVHFRFPGCERAPEEVLDALMASSVHVQEAGHPVRITGLEATVVIEAVHLLRDARDPRAMELLDALIRAAAAKASGARVVEEARALGALATAEPFLRRAFPDDVPDDCGRPSAEWLMFSRNTLAGSVRLEFLLSARGRSIPGMLLRAVWPTKEALAANDLTVLSMSRRDVNRRRLERLRRGFCDAPVIIGEARDYFRVAGRHRRAGTDRASELRAAEKGGFHERR